MTTVRYVLQGILALCFFVAAICIVRDYLKNKEQVPTKKRCLNYAFGAFDNFLDALGIGSFAPAAAFYRLTKMVDDKRIPGTLVVGCTLPVLLEALTMIQSVEVRLDTLISMVLCSSAGAFLGSKINHMLPVRGIRLTMGSGLLLAAILMLGSMFNFLPTGGDLHGITGFTLVIACACVFVLGALYPLGIGNYAPTLVLVSFLGMNPKVAFPIMMCSAAFNNISAFNNIMKSNEFHREISFGFNVGGVVGVLIAVTIFVSLPMDILRWLVLFVVVYTGITMLYAALKNQSDSKEDVAEPTAKCTSSQ